MNIQNFLLLIKNFIRFYLNAFSKNINEAFWRQFNPQSPQQWPLFVSEPQEWRLLDNVLAYKVEIALTSQEIVYKHSDNVFQRSKGRFNMEKDGLNSVRVKRSVTNQSGFTTASISEKRYKKRSTS